MLDDDATPGRMPFRAAVAALLVSAASAELANCGSGHGLQADGYCENASQAQLLDGCNASENATAEASKDILTAFQGLCARCKAGQYSADGYVCLPCLEGFYQPDAGKDFCQPCPAEALCADPASLSARPGYYKLTEHKVTGVSYEPLGHLPKH